MLRIRPMSADDLSLAIRLKGEAGWNQLEADWRRFLAMQPDGCLVAELKEMAVGTAVATLFGEVAWISMVLVDASVRGRGIGKSLMRHALEFADGHGAKTVRLDATPLGQPLYEQLGFAPQYDLTRFVGMLPAAGSKGTPAAAPGVISTARQEDYGEILKLDHAVTLTQRDKFLLRLFEEQPETVQVIRRGSAIDGYLTVRPGSDALQIGPCIASADTGGELFADVLRRSTGRQVYWDVPASHHAAVQLAQAAGLQPQRQLLRMCRGTVVNDDVNRLWASSGPELG